MEPLTPEMSEKIQRIMAAHRQAQEAQYAVRQALIRRPDVALDILESEQESIRQSKGRLSTDQRRGIAAALRFASGGTLSRRQRRAQAKSREFLPPQKPRGKYGCEFTLMPKDLIEAGHKSRISI